MRGDPGNQLPGPKTPFSCPSGDLEDTGAVHEKIVVSEIQNRDSEIHVFSSVSIIILLPK